LSLITQFISINWRFCPRHLPWLSSPLLKDFSTLGGNFNHSKWLGVILHQVTMKVTIEALDLQEVPLHLLLGGLLNLWLVLIFGIGLVPFSLVLKHLL
jgi:hypothetical protein